MIILKKSSFLLFFTLVFFLPTSAQENCTNGIDDDGDGLIDCLDPDCLSDPGCPAFAVPGGCLPIGYYPSIIGTQEGFKAANQIADVSIPITNSAERISLIIQGVYQQGAIQNLTGLNDVNYGEERIVWGRVEIDLTLQTSSGWVEYFANNHDSRRYSWVDEPLSANMTNTYTTVGHDMGELTDFNFSFNHTAPNLIVGCSRPDVDISYFTVDYGDFATQSLTRIEGANPTQYPAYFAAGVYTQTIDLQAAPNNPNYIILRGIGINQNRYGTGGTLVNNTREETLALKYIICDLNTMTASGVMTVNGGNIPSMNTSFTFSNYDLTSNIPITANATLAGDFAGNILPPDQITVSDMTIQVVGNQLIITRSNVFGDDYNEMYYVELLQYTNQPYSSSFFITKNAYSSPNNIGFDAGSINDGVGVSGFVDFTIPAGSKRAYIEMRANGLWSNLNLVGPTVVNSSITNDNQMYAFSEVNFDLNQTTGYYATLTTSTQQQIYAWQNVPFGVGNINASGIYGQLPITDERIDYEFVAPDIFRVHLTNDKVAYERIMQITFLGSKINLVYSSFDQNNSIFTGCDSVYFDMEICNSGGADLAQSVPISFYNGDPTIDPNAIYLQTEPYNLNIAQGQCEIFTFGVDITSLGGTSTGDITIVLNDNGLYSGTPGNQIPSIWSIGDLVNQGNTVLECEFDQNIITATWNQPLPPPPTTTFNQNTFVICPGDIANIIATPSGTTGEIDYQWTPGGAADTLNTLSVNPNMDTWYYLNMSDVCHDIIDSVKVTIGNADITNITIVDASNCPGQVSPNLGSVTVLPNNPLWSYTLGVVGPQNTGVFNNLVGGQTYLLHVVSDDGCITDSLITVGLDAALAITADWIIPSLSDVTCFGDQDGAAEIQDIQGGITAPYDVTWTNIVTGLFSSQSNINAGGGDAINNLYGGQWIVTVSDQLGCSWSQSFDILEADELILDLSSYSEPSCFEANDGDITVQIIGGNALTDGVGTVSISNSNGDILNSGVSDLTVNNLITDTYTVLVIDDNGCTATQDLLINQPDELAIDFTLIDPVCYGIATGSIAVDTVYNYQGLYDDIYYQWVPNPNGNDGIGFNSTTYLGEGSYQLKITDDNDCYKFFDFVINYPDSIFFDELGFIPAICRNQVPFDNGQGQIYAAAAGGGDGNGNGTSFSYEWVENQTGATTNNSTWGNRNPGTYIITATNDLGCIISDIIYVDSLSPESIFTITSPDFTSPYEGTAVVDVTINNQSLNYAFSQDINADTSFVWTFGFEGEVPYITSNINEVINKPYLSEGVYEICLIVIENLNGCVDTSCQEIIIHDFPSLIVPNVFTPGSDGVNDEFYFPNVAIIEFNCLVFDRWGKQVFEFISINDKWDGKNMNNQKDCTDGVYFYKYTGLSTNDTHFEGQGNVHLIRE